MMTQISWIDNAFSCNIMDLETEVGITMEEDILLIIENNTKENKGTPVSDISFILEKSKNLVARTLTKLVDENIVFSVEEPELLYYDKLIYQIQNNVTLRSNRYTNLTALDNENSQDERRDFEKLIGYQDSLVNCVEQCKAAISYPNNPLPTLLYGPTGTGKSFIAKLMYEYALNEGIISSDKHFVTMNCSEFADNPELLTANLFGHKKGAFTGADHDNVGLIKVADGGVLFLDEVHCLSKNCQEKLFLFMDKGIYHKVGENEVWEHSSVTLILATTENPEEVLLPTFLRRIPIIVTIPSLKDRGLYEKIQLIYSSLLDESKLIKKKIRLSNFVYNILVNYDFDGNVGDLKNVIKVCCASALIDEKDNAISIHMKHLPTSLFKRNIEYQNSNLPVDNKLIELEELNVKHYVSCKLTQLFDDMLTIKEQDQFLEQSRIKLKEYYNHLIYDNRENFDDKNHYVSERIARILEQEFNRYNIKINNSDQLTLQSYVEDLLKNLIRVFNWQQEHETEMTELLEYVSTLYTRESMIAESIEKKVSHVLDISFGPMFIILLTLNLKTMNHEESYNRRLGIILAHGFSTASSIANAANTLLDEYIFEAIDMPVDVSNQEVINLLNSYLVKMNNYDELVLLVDMGSLEEIHKGITVDINVDIGIINNITTKLALEIGNELRLNTPLETILRNASELNPFKYHIIKRKVKKDVLLCACASGLGTAEKIKSLLTSSLDTSTAFEILTYDYNSLIGKDTRDLVFEQYNVIGIIGTLNPDIENVLFVPLEELILEQDVELLDKMFNKYLSKEQIEVFKKNLLKNFSLTNLMDNLTILNPSKLLENVASALDEFQGIYGIQIPNATSVGLYVHTCCMIERLVTHQPFDNYAELDKLKANNQSFIRAIKKSFKNVEKYYGVIIPEDEMGYIYDYIENNS